MPSRRLAQQASPRQQHRSGVLGAWNSFPPHLERFPRPEMSATYPPPLSSLPRASFLPSPFASFPSPPVVHPNLTPRRPLSLTPRPELTQPTTLPRRPPLRPPGGPNPLTSPAVGRLTLTPTLTPNPNPKPDPYANPLTSLAVGRSAGSSLSSLPMNSLASSDTVSHSGPGKSYLPCLTDAKISLSVLP